MVDRRLHEPLYIQVKNHIIEEIESGRIKVGDRLMSETEMQQFYGVARPTIRAALAELVAEGCLRKEHGLGTFCAAVPRRDRILNVDVIVNQDDTYFTPYMLRGISRILENNSCNLLLHNSSLSAERTAELLERIIDRGSDGVILQAPERKYPGWTRFTEALNRLDAAKIPMVSLLGRDILEEISGKNLAVNLSLDDACGMEIVTRYVLDCGHRRILALTDPQFSEDAACNRFSGFYKVMKSCADAVPFELLRQEKNFGDVLRLIREEGITAVLCFNDALAVEFLHVLVENGIRVPEELSLAGFDDTDLSRSCIPQMTTVTHPKDQMGSEAANLILRWVQNPALQHENVLYRPGLAIRRSICER